ncbi:hypothetical protein ED733_003551 [Metarhizium rileyi]|uniref:Uncharacterized protein n=1 Tax=Metarhizium rileyi (strain RCEF 4871) TaxID=1649241 RepID=A0A5C6G5U8_METRR|nr:hypothetical protein ED733_003551 [Metarhizium rileyi]
MSRVCTLHTTCILTTRFLLSLRLWRPWLTSDTAQQKASVSNCKPNFKVQQWQTRAKGAQLRVFAHLGSESVLTHQLQNLRGVIIVPSALERLGIATDSDELVSPAIQEHYDGVNSVLPTSMRRPCVVSAASECGSMQSAPVLPPRDEALHQENTEPPCQPWLASNTTLVQPSQSQNCRVVSSSKCSQIHSINVDHSHMGDTVLQSDDELHSVARPASAKTPRSKCSRPVSRRGGLTEGVQKHQAADDIPPMDSHLTSSPTSQGWDEECQRSISADYAVSQPEEPCEEMEKRSSSRCGFKKAYNLRCLSVKR